MKKPNPSVLKLRLSAFLYGIVFICALWVVAYAITGNLLRSFMFIVALLLASVVYGQSKSMTRSADMLEIMPYIKQFDEEIKSGETVYSDPFTGKFRKSK